MKEDVRHLLLSKSEVSRLSNTKDSNPGELYAGVIVIAITIWMFFNFMAASIVFSAVMLFLLGQSIYQNRSLKNRTYKTLLEEVRNYNRLVKTIDVVDQLEDAGNPVHVDDREKIIQRLSKLKGELVRALKTERIYRENRDIIPGPYERTNNLTVLEAVEFNEKSTEYNRLIKESLEIALKVQDEMESFIRGV